MKTDLSMDDDQFARFIDLLSDKCKEDTWQSLSDMVINAGLHALETMDEEKDNHTDESSEDREKLVYVCKKCRQSRSCILTVEADIESTKKHRCEVWSGSCPLNKGANSWNKASFKLVREK